MCEMRVSHAQCVRVESPAIAVLCLNSTHLDSYDVNSPPPVLQKWTLRRPAWGRLSHNVNALSWAQIDNNSVVHLAFHIRESAVRTIHQRILDNLFSMPHPFSYQSHAFCTRFSLIFGLRGWDLCNSGCHGHIQKLKKGVQSGNCCAQSVWLAVCVENSIVGGLGSLVPRPFQLFVAFSTYREGLVSFLTWVTSG